jgi:hypothetical protein
MPRKTKGTSGKNSVPRPLVLNRIEKVSKEVFRQYFKEITELVGNSPGIYALYDGNELYYVGKSNELRRRVKQHLRDRHLASWTHFNLYLVRKVEHIHEIESLLVRIANPKGNRVVPKGKSSGPLLKELQAMVRRKQKEEFTELFGGGRTITKGVRRQTPKGKRTLIGLVSKRTALYRSYKGRDYRAALNPNGTIVFRGRKYSTAGAAAKSIVKRPVNGWGFWYIEDLNGDWIKLYKYKS